MSIFSPRALRPVSPKKGNLAFSDDFTFTGYSGAAPLTGEEERSIKALVAYMAHKQNLREETVASIVEDHFNVMHVSDLRRRNFDEAIRYLVDLCDAVRDEGESRQ